MKRFNLQWWLRIPDNCATLFHHFVKRTCNGEVMCIATYRLHASPRSQPDEDVRNLVFGAVLQLTNSMQRSPSLEANSYSASDKLPRILCNLNSTVRSRSVSWGTTCVFKLNPAIYVDIFQVAAFLPSVFPPKLHAFLVCHPYYISSCPRHYMLLIFDWAVRNVCPSVAVLPPSEPNWSCCGIHRCWVTLGSMPTA